MTSFARDLVSAARSLRRAPGYAVAFVLTLGLGIGVNTSIFSVINGVLLKGLPFEDADRIMYLRQAAPRAGVTNARFSFQEVAEYRRGVDAFDEVVEFGDWTFAVVPPDGEPHRAVGGLVTSNYFEVLGLSSMLGRTLRPDDEGEGAEPVMVLTHDYWTRAYGADSTVVGRTVEITGLLTAPKNVRIVGVLEPGSHYTGTRRQDFFVNYASNDHYLGATMQDQRTHRMTDIFARLRPGVSVETARAQVEAVADAVHEEFPSAYPEDLGVETVVSPWQEELTRDARPTLLILMGTVLVVLVLACANVANLTLTRLVKKRHELATRVALGASAGRMRRDLLAENLVLAAGGALLGLVMAFVSLDLLVAYTGRFTVRTGEIGMDAPVLLFSLLAGVAIAVFLAWAPGMPVAPSAVGSLAGSAGGRTSADRSRKRVQRGLVVVQLALSFTLLMGAGLLVRSLVNLTSVDPGFDAENVLTLEATTTGRTNQENRQLFEEVLHRVREFPGVRTAAVASWPPLRSANPVAWSFRVEGGEVEGTRSPRAAFNNVTPGYFETVGIPLVRGRTLTAMDTEETDTVAVVNQSFARAYFEGDDPLGRRISWSFNGTNWSTWARIVGVVGDTREYGLTEQGVHTVYLPSAQRNYGPTLLLRTTGDPASLASFAVETVHDVDPSRPVDRIQTLEELRSEDVAPHRLNATLFGTFAALALVIAAVGVFGVLGFSVSQRIHEFGIRMAVGAERSTVLAMVLKEGVLLTGVALLVGAAGAVALSRLLSELLFAVEPLDPVSLLAAAGLLGGAALLASYLPARRATRVDPSVALRGE